MKIPTEIKRLLKRRCWLASELLAVDSKVSRFIQENDIPVEDYDYLSGCEMYEKGMLEEKS